MGSGGEHRNHAGKRKSHGEFWNSLAKSAPVLSERDLAKQAFVGLPDRTILAHRLERDRHRLESLHLLREACSFKNCASGVHEAVLRLDPMTTDWRYSRVQVSPWRDVFDPLKKRHMASAASKS